ncbi:serine/threonine-protein kinase PRP4 homolog isoform X2 [Oryza brachyantha]|uniref:serine/threonine-protein kinase PRP4 homolog isoform X2 n=1 Tax=Oryza brachyantha TaxID=4533 RepID=UPI001ADBFDDA|nr:serine/threonine-protein kinase PRP4 homolog isoform X2 [Oryza brachyantha]
MAEEPSPSPSSTKHNRSPDSGDPADSPKRRRRHHRHEDDGDDSPLAAEDDVEEGEILDDAMDVDAAAPDAAPEHELCGNHDQLNSDADAGVLRASRLPSHSSSRDERKSNHTAHESTSGGIVFSDADDTKGYRESQRVSKSPQLTRGKDRKYKDEHKSHRKDSHLKEHSRRSPSRHTSQDHARYHSRSRDTGAEANGSRASTREDSDRDSNDRKSKHGRHATRSRENERERSSSHVVCDEVYGEREIYKHERRHRDNPVDRDKMDLHELTRRDRERSSSHSRSDRRESAHHIRDESRESERRSSSLKHKDNDRKDRIKDRYKESDRVESGHDRDKMRDDRDRARHKDLESGKRRNGEGKDRDSNIDKYKDSSRSKYNTSDGHKHRSRSRERGKGAERRGQRSEGLKENSSKEEDEEEYQEKIEQQLAMQEEDDPEKIKEEARRRKEAIMAKYRQQQLQKQQLEILPKSNDEEMVEMNRGDNADPKDGIDSRFVASEEAENKHDSSDAIVGETDFTVGKSPANSDGVGTLDNQRTTGVSGLGEGTPKSERSADMFCDDIFGESPAGFRKLGKDDGLHIEKNALHDNWDDAEGYYTYRFGELLDGRYEIIAAHGKGVFSTVVRAKDLKAGKDDPEEVAIKIIRNNETMYKAGKQEVSILEKLASADREDRRHCLFIALKHLKNCKVLHCDIKPDNMLVNEAKNVLKLCDFGNAMFAGMNEVTPYLVSRFYRAPEIILGLPYDHPLDMWSVGCCLYELYTGKVLFPGPSNNDMLRLHMELKGPFPKKMLRKGAFTMQHFDQDLNFHATEEDPVTKKAVTRVILNIKPKDIGSLISNFPGEDPKMLSNFKDLLEKIFVLDPEKRITISQALSHPFITGK